MRPRSAPLRARAEDESVATFKVNVNLVDVFFTVKDKNGNLVPHLTKDDCTVSEDKAPQTLKSFAAETASAADAGNSAGHLGQPAAGTAAGAGCGQPVSGARAQAKDEAFLLSFDVDVDLLQDYTNNPRLLARAMSKAEINTAGGNGAAGIPGAGGGTVPTIGAPKGTVLYDAVYQAAKQKMNQESGRKAMILLTDGEDEGSSVKINDAIAAAQKSNVIVYVILIADRGFYGGFGYSGYSAMKKLTEETGGRLIDVGNNGKKLEAAFQQIEDELRTQYVASYTPTNTKLDGSFRKIGVECRGDGLKVRVRKGYYAVAAEN